MKYQCYNCKKLFIAKDIIIMSPTNGYGKTYMQPVCENCIANEEKENEEKKYDPITRMFRRTRK